MAKNSVGSSNRKDLRVYFQKVGWHWLLKGCMTFAKIELTASDNAEFSNIGDETLDGLFGSNRTMPAQGITEFYGASGSGKTQIVLHLALFFLTHSNNPRVVYVSTESFFPIKRFRELLQQKLTRDYENGSEKSADKSKTVEEYGNRLLLTHEPSVESLMNCLTVRIPKLVSECDGIKCVIVDSIAAVFRCVRKSEIPYDERSRILFKMAAALKRLSVEKGMSVIVTNQVSDIFPNDVFHVNQRLVADKKPALGLSWSHCVTTRILVSKCDPMSIPVTLPGGKQSQLALRRLHVISSPFCPNSSTFFVVDSNGISSVHENPTL